MALQNIYYAKYLKYKNKYLELKNNSGGGMFSALTKDDEYTFFSSHDKFKNLFKKYPIELDDKGKVKEGQKAPGLTDVEKVLSLGGYRIKKGSDELKFVVSDMDKVKIAGNKFVDGAGVAVNITGEVLLGVGKLGLAVGEGLLKSPLFIMSLLRGGADTKTVELPKSIKISKPYDGSDELDAEILLALAKYNPNINTLLSIRFYPTLSTKSNEYKRYLKLNK